MTFPTPFAATRRRLLAAPLLIAAMLLAILSPGAALAQGYGVSPGDTLRIEVLEDPSLNRSVLVAPDGRISVPQAGSLRASGRTVEAIQSDLTARLADSFAVRPNVYVGLEQLAPRQPAAPRTPTPAPVIGVYVMGEVAKAGRLEVAPGTNVLQLFAVMGGFTKFAALKRIQLRRTDPKTGVPMVYKLNYAAIEAGATNGGQATLMDGDVIVVPQRRLFE